MASFVPIRRLDHFAYRCRDSEETRHFYEDILGLPLIHVIQQDRVPSTQEYAPHAHIFFRMTDGSCIAFFDLGDNEAAASSANTPRWVNHLALRVDSEAALATALEKLRGAGLEVLGPTDHGFIKSIYFFDPNGIRLELSAPANDLKPETLEAHARSAHAELAEWNRGKHARLAIAPVR